MKLFKKKSDKNFKKKSNKLWETFILTELARDQYEVGSDEYLLLNEVCKEFSDKYLDQVIKENKK